MFFKCKIDIKSSMIIVLFFKSKTMATFLQQVIKSCTFESVLCYAYQERWRERPFETLATCHLRQGANS